MIMLDSTQNKILIIGNGFDLYHNLPTRYSDFLFFAQHWNEFKRFYDEKNVDLEHETARLVDIRLGENGELTSLSLEDFAEHASYFSEEHINYLDEHLQYNAWLTYFNKSDVPGRNWIDFEAEIQRVLQQVEIYYTEFLPTIKDAVVPEQEMTSTMKDAVLTFSKRLREVNRHYENVAVKPICGDGDRDPEVLHANKEMLLAYMKKELDALDRCLDYYLQDFVSVIDCNIYSEQIKALGDVQLLNFNYTYTYNTVYGERPDLEHHHIHGELKEDNLVLGIADDSFEGSIDYVYFQKYFQRIQKRTGSLYKKWLSNESGLTRLKYKVYIMGHSLGAADRGVLKDFFCDDENVEQITIFYHDQMSYESQVINLIAMFGKDFVIEQTGNNRIVFEKLRIPIKGKPRTS